MTTCIHNHQTFGASLDTSEPRSATLLLAQVADGMSEAEAGYTRRLTAAKLQGRSIEEVEKIQNRNILKEIKKRVQVSSAGSRGLSYSRVDVCSLASPQALIKKQ